MKVFVACFVCFKLFETRTEFIEHASYSLYESIVFFSACQKQQSVYWLVAMEGNIKLYSYLKEECYV